MWSFEVMSFFFNTLITSKNVTIVIDVMIDKKIGQNMIMPVESTLPIMVTGTISQYQTVAIVTIARRIASGIEAII
jgi:hypothetical protein